MGQSQPQQTAPSSSLCSNYYDGGNYTTLIKKLGNPKMVPNDEFTKYITEGRENSIDKSSVYNYNNCSIYEEELPEELFIAILGYLTSTEIFKLERVSKNFKYYWTRNIVLWRERSLIDDHDQIFMYYKPIMDTPMKSIVNYYRFKQVLLNSFKEQAQKSKEAIIFKQILFGKECCGKSELAHKFSDSNYKFNEKYQQTIGIEFYVNDYECNNKLFRIQLWDTGGSDRYKSVVSVYKRGAKSIIYCFDLSDKESFTVMKKLMVEHNGSMPSIDYLNSEDLNMVIIGLKRELPRAVSMSQVDDLLRELVPNGNGNGISLADLKIQYFEISSKIDSRQNIILPLLFGLLMSEESI